MSLNNRKWLPIAAATLISAVSQLSPATAHADLHNIKYIARIDGVTTGSQATFVLNGNQTGSTGLSSVPGNVFEADTVLPDPQQAGIRIVLRWPYSANVHCEIDVDDQVFTQLDQLVAPKPNSGDPTNGVLQCGATPDRLGIPSG
jgi:hypothetical protein